ncbi:MAG: LLM class flavin-dependent oxidoreductase [Ilumatobacteraceae bacterium]
MANYTAASTDPRDFARMAEDAGFDGVGCSDHLFRTSPYPHLWVTISAMAQVTRRVIVTSSFANNLLRSPVEFAQASLTMQWLSDGRFEAGLGAGWLRPEVLAAGLDYPDAPVRARRYLEAMTIVRSLFDHGSCTFQGEHYSVDVPTIGPRVASPPPLVASVGGPWTIASVSPLAERVELKFGRSTRGGELDMAAWSTTTRAELRSMIEQVRAVAPEVPIGVFTTIAVGDRQETAPIRESLGEGLYGRLTGEPGEVIDGLRSLEDLGLDRVHLTERLPGSIRRLAAAMGR